MERAWIAIANASLIVGLGFMAHVTTDTANAAISGCTPSTFQKVSDGIGTLPDQYNSSALCNAGATTEIGDRKLLFNDPDCPKGSFAATIRVAKDEWGLSPQRDNSIVLRWLVRLPADVRMEISKGTSTSISGGAGLKFERGPWELETSITYEAESGSTERWNFNEKRNPGSGGGLVAGQSFAQTYVASIVETRYWRYYQEICVNWKTNKVTELQKAVGYEFYRNTTLTPIWRAALSAKVQENAHYLQPNVNGQFYPIANVKQCTGTEPSARQWTLNKGNGSLKDQWVRNAVTFGVSSSAGRLNMNLSASGSTTWTLSLSNGGAPKSSSQAYPPSPYKRFVCSVQGDAPSNKGTFQDLRGTGWNAGEGKSTVPPFGMVIGITTIP